MAASCCWGHARQLPAPGWDVGGRDMGEDGGGYETGGKWCSGRGE